MNLTELEEQIKDIKQQLTGTDPISDTIRYYELVACLVALQESMIKELKENRV